MPLYLVVIEKAGSNYSAFAPDVPGCVATGDTVESTVAEMKSALEFHLEDKELPQPRDMAYHLSNGTFKEISGEYYIT